MRLVFARERKAAVLITPRYISRTRVRNALSSFFISIVALMQAEARLGKSAVMYAHQDVYCVLQFMFEIMRVSTPNADSNPKSKFQRHPPFIIPNPQPRLGLPAPNWGEWVAPIRACDLFPTDYPHVNISTGSNTKPLCNANHVFCAVFPLCALAITRATLEQRVSGKEVKVRVRMKLKFRLKTRVRVWTHIY